MSDRAWRVRERARGNRPLDRPEISVGWWRSKKVAESDSLSPPLFAKSLSPRTRKPITLDRRERERTCASAPAEERATTTSGRRASSDKEEVQRRRREERRAAFDGAIERKRRFLSSLPSRRSCHESPSHAHERRTEHAAGTPDREGFGPNARVRRRESKNEGPEEGGEEKRGKTRMIVDDGKIRRGREKKHREAIQSSLWPLFLFRQGEKPGGFRCPRNPAPRSFSPSCAERHRRG